jgi:hypothetical protein
MADLEAIMSERPETIEQNQPEQRQEAPAQVEQQGQPRDDQGRFAGQQQPPEAPQATPEAGKPPEGFIPIQALDARLSKAEEKYQNLLREQAEAFQRQMAAFQHQQQPKPEPPKPVDFFENPDAAFDSRLQQAVQPIQQGQQQIVENFSRMMAADKFGEEAVNTALAEMTRRVNANPNGMRFDYQRIMSAPHPYGELVKWHKAQSALSTYGDDPTAYREKLRAEILAEMQGGQQQPGQQAQARRRSILTPCRPRLPATAGRRRHRHGRVRVPFQT